MFCILYRCMFALSTTSRSPQRVFKSWWILAKITQLYDRINSNLYYWPDVPVWLSVSIAEQTRNLNHIFDFCGKLTALKTRLKRLSRDTFYCFTLDSSAFVAASDGDSYCQIYLWNSPTRTSTLQRSILYHHRVCIIQHHLEPLLWPVWLIYVQTLMQRWVL